MWFLWFLLVHAILSKSVCLRCDRSWLCGAHAQAVVREDIHRFHKGGLKSRVVACHFTRKRNQELGANSEAQFKHTITVDNAELEVLRRSEAVRGTALRDSPKQQSHTSYTGPCETNCMVWSAAAFGCWKRIWICVSDFHPLYIVSGRGHDNRCSERRTTLFIRRWSRSLTRDTPGGRRQTMILQRGA